MPINIEIKARLRDPQRTCRLAETAADSPPQLLHQTDTFFQVPEGRLKLREFPDAPAELIFYRRPDQTGPKASNYAIHRTDDGPGLRALMGAALGEAGTVSKIRTLLMAGRTRIHLDKVEGLGHFLELEVVLADGDKPIDGEIEARELMATLEVEEADLVDEAYIDLLAKQNG
jgi:adenylate cyclase class IV